MSQLTMNKCPICEELIGENHQSINISYGFGDNMPVMFSLLMHRECTDGIDCVKYLMNYFEMGD